MLAPVYSAAEKSIISSALSGVSYATWTGVRCKTANVSGDWSYDGSTYITNSNSGWCSGEPNAGCGSEQCMQFYASGCWNDLSCSNALGYVCAVPICKREQTLATSTQAEVRVSQGAVDFEADITKPAVKYTPDGSFAPACTLLYSTPDGASPTSTATMTIAGDKMKISATLVNKLAIASSDWLVTKTIRVTMDSNSSVAAKDHTVALRVIPCAITASTITIMTIGIGDK
jgi:hypothetical protein